ncbi:MAG: hypothetical protein B7C24_09670 [Bacteroidetes bacterium 4572_77]|nr:MAG: hypothetical protein B7C24_09670 [Bacteroidetes bacterium 4572_77]
MRKINLVTGANGHLGNNIVRELLKNGEKVRASVRNINNKKPFEGLNIDLVYADLLDKDSLRKVMKNVDTLYQVAAVFKHWSKNPEKEIIQANLDITRNILEVAAEFKVRKIVYISSFAAISHHNPPINESTWNTDFSNDYYKSKVVSEKLAWELAKKHGLDLVSVLPSAIIGPNNFDHLTTTMEFYHKVLNNNIPIDPNFSFNVVDVRDVAKGAILASEKGVSGERYVLATPPTISTSKMFEIAKQVKPRVEIKKPIPKRLMLLMASTAEMISKLSGKEPLMMKNQVRLYYKADLRVDISKAQKELGYDPRNPEQAIKETFEYLLERK